MVTGYLHSQYAESLSEFGTPRELPRCGGWVLERPIPGFPYRDAMGCYPLFACEDWSQLSSDVEDMSEDLVTLAVVTDPFGAYDEAFLRRCFSEVVIPFKQHYIVDLEQPLDSFVSSHHRRNALKAGRDVTVEICERPAEVLDIWDRLYATLIERHQIKGITRFSRNSFARQLTVPGMVAFQACYRGECVGMTLWYVQGQVGYYHLGAYSAIGYELHASFALFAYSVDYFAKHLRWLDLGAGAGLGQGNNDGLARFKHGWSTGSRTAYFCGRIFNVDKYTEIVRAKEICKTSYFPAYRQGEYG
jgi:hypothetical protein